MYAPRLGLFPFLLACALLAAPGCHGSSAPSTGELVAAPTELVAAHTAGTVSRKSPFEVHFVRDVVEESVVGQPLVAGDTVFHLTPAVEGELSWTSRSVLTFRPKADLVAGTTYTAHVCLLYTSPSPRD